MSDRSSLHWFPMYPADFLSSPAVGMMLPEQRGAYVTLLCFAWGDGSAEPSVADDDEALALMSGLGKRWAKFGPLVRAQFDARDGRIYNAKLSDVWHAQQRKHSAVAEKGRKGGKAKAERKPGSSSARAQGVVDGYQSELEGAVEALPLTGQELLPAPAPDGDPAPADAAQVAAGANTTTTSGRDYLDNPGTREYLARLGRRPDGAVVQSSDVQEREAGRVAWESHYHVVVADHTVAWIEANREAARAIGFSERARLGLPQKGELPDFQASTLRACVYGKIRERNGWPSLAEWDGRETFDDAAAGALEEAAS